MYTREIQAPQGSPIENGTPVQGTWSRAFDEVDLLEIRRPYSWPLPRWLRDCRIKEWEYFAIQDERFFMEALLGNVKLYRIVQIFLYDRENGEKFVFRKLMPGSGWRLPRSLANASVDSRSSRFFVRVHTWLNADTIKLDIHIAATSRYPAFTAHLAYGMARSNVTPVAVSLNFTERRNMYAFKALAPVRGDITLEGRHISFDPKRCSGIFCDYKGFYPYRMEGVFCGAMGFDGEGRRYGFHIAENQTREARKNNENALWLNGRLIPLPQVWITMPGGAESDWIIQDVEGMVDLVFSPSVQNKWGASLLLTSAGLDTHLGQFNGMLASADGEQIQVCGLWGMGERLKLRV
ncbi:MAG: DUF2804 domain-containing protein [Treponema sp.]|jgi:hypothetical protein|nr:DUF2804 domain-containing protein [Treponema sp.]